MNNAEYLTRPKVAVCFYGLIGAVGEKNGEGNPVDFSFCARSLQRALQFCEVDYFVHSWSVGADEIIRQFINPVRMLIEPGLKYDEQRFKHYVKKKARPLDYLLNILSPNRQSDAEKYAYRAYSRWTSVNRSISLIPKSQLSSYDFILSTRLDLEFFSSILFPETGQDEIICSHWNSAVIPGSWDRFNQQNASLDRPAFLDLWFAGRPQAMLKFSTLIDRFSEYSLSPHSSSYEHAVWCGLSPRYYLYRGFDFELVRRSTYGSVK